MMISNKLQKRGDYKKVSSFEHCVLFFLWLAKLSLVGGESTNLCLHFVLYYVALILDVFDGYLGIGYEFTKYHEIYWKVSV